MKGDHTPHCTCTSRRVSEKRDSACFAIAYNAALQAAPGVLLGFIIGLRTSSGGAGPWLSASTDTFQHLVDLRECSILRIVASWKN